MRRNGLPQPGPGPGWDHWSHGEVNVWIDSPEMPGAPASVARAQPALWRQIPMPAIPARPAPPAEIIDTVAGLRLEYTRMFARSAPALRDPAGMLRHMIARLDRMANTEDARSLRRTLNDHLANLMRRADPASRPAPVRSERPRPVAPRPHGPLLRPIVVGQGLPRPRPRAAMPLPRPLGPPSSDEEDDLMALVRGLQLGTPRALTSLRADADDDWFLERAPPPPLSHATAPPDMDMDDAFLAQDD